MIELNMQECEEVSGGVVALAAIGLFALAIYTGYKVGEHMEDNCE